MPHTVATYTIESECRECGEHWESTVHPATYWEPRCETEPSCPHCGGHDTDCDCLDCRKGTAA